MFVYCQKLPYVLGFSFMGRFLYFIFLWCCGDTCIVFFSSVYIWDMLVSGYHSKMVFSLLFGVLHGFAHRCSQYIDEFKI